MASGRKVEVYNTRERVLSTDHNREQAFAADDDAEVLRKFMSTAVILDGSAGLEVELDSVDTPLEGHILGGLLVDPQSGTDDLLITPGIVGLVDPDGQAGSSDPNPASPDDNVFKYVRSDGIVAGGVLQLAANPAGSIRIDVVECRRLPVDVVETDNRDIFDPSTGRFTPIAVDKVVRSQLEFRVRQGTPGAGLPANVQGWLPLCVVSIPATTVSPVVDAATFWDVRPLISDRIRPPFNGVRSFSRSFHPSAWGNDSTSPGVANIWSGHLEGENNQYLAGGVLRSGVPGTGDGDAIDIMDVRNQDGAIATVDFNWYLWALFPGGLPRWVRYTEAAPRIPGPFRGIPTVSQVGPISLSNSTPLVPIAVPAITGLLATAGFGTCLAAGHVGSGTAIPSIGGSIKRSKYQASLRNGITLGAATATSGAPGANIFAFWHLTNGPVLPPNARTVLVSIQVSLVDAGTPGAQVEFRTESSTFFDLVSGDPNGVLVDYRTFSVLTSGGGVTSQMGMLLEFPVHSDWPIGTHPSPSTPSFPDQRIGVRFIALVGSWSFSITNAQVVGWTLGD